MLITPYHDAQVKRMAPFESEKPFIPAFLKLCLIAQCLALGGSLRDSTEIRPEFGRLDNRKQPILRWRGLSSLVLMLGCLHCYRASGQVVPSVRMPPRFAVFGTFTDIKPTWHVVGDLAVYGATVGGYVQTPHLFGLELRGSITRWGGPQHQEAIALGPRVALHFGRISPYAVVLAGVTNSWEYHNPQKPVQVERASPALTILGGVDLRMAHHISLRVGEASYSRIHRSDLDLNTFGVSAGVVYRIPGR